MSNHRIDTLKRFGRELLIIVISSLSVIYVATVVRAGSLTPSGPTAHTLTTLQEVFNPLASTSYDSSAVTADPNGNGLQIMKCIISKINTGTCP